MKSAILLLLVGCLILGCNSNNSETTPSTQVTLTGQIVIYDQTGIPATSSTGIKVTILENQQVQYTNSSGVYTFINVPPGIYNFKFEYKDYPPIFLFDYSVFYADNLGYIGTPDGFGIGPESTSLCNIDSVYYANVHFYNFTEGVFTDSLGCFIFIGSSNQTDSSSAPSVLLIGKQYDQVDYGANSYVDLAYGMAESSPFNFYYFTANFIHNIGFVKGDSIYFRAYPLTSPSFYVDTTTNKKVFPSIGAGSNIVGTVVQ